MDFNAQLLGILETLYKKTNRKHDCHYEEGQGAIFVPMNVEVHPNNIVLSVSQQELVMLGMGASVNFNLRY